MTVPVLNPNEPEYGTKEYYELMTKKAVAPWDPPASPYDSYFDAAFSNEIEEYVSRDSTLYRILRKETFQRVGDSWKFFSSDISATQEVASSSTPFASGSTESGPDFDTIEKIEPAWLVTPYETNFFSDITSQWQPYPNNNVAYIKKYFQDVTPNDYDIFMTDDVDSARTAANRIESIDRLISDKTESGGTTFVSAATDGDIYYGKSSLVIDRSDSDYSYADAQVDLPDTADARVLDLGMIDDVFADCLDYAGPNPEYIMLTGPRTLNEIAKLEDDKQRYIGETEVQFTTNGVKTRSGIVAGQNVAAYKSNGYTIPIFTNKHISGENGNNLTTKVDDADIGHIYLINMADMHIRIALPPMYTRTGPEQRLAMDSFDDRHWILAGMQLVATKWQTHGAVKYLKAS